MLISVPYWSELSSVLPAFLDCSQISSPYPYPIMRHVAFIPTQTPDEAAFTSDRAALKSPLRLLGIDLWILLKNLRYLPNAILPYRKLAPLPGVRYGFSSKVDDIMIMILATLEVVVLLVTGPVVALLPGFLSVIYCVAVCLVVYLLQLPMWGGLIVRSKVDSLGWKNHDKERWFYLNGIATK